MQICELGHSGFSVEGEHGLLLFDYSKGTLPEPAREKAITIFVSHHHPDHFNPEIFAWGEHYANTQYFLGRDMRLSPGNRARWNVTEEMLPRIRRVGGGETLELGECSVKTLPSTDAGVAYFVKFEEKCIYHAGDLNLWVWGEDAEYDRRMQDKFARALETIDGETIDAAFLPLDPRLGEHFADGFDAFARRFQPARLLPMHMWDDRQVIDRLRSLPCAADYASRILRTGTPGARFEI